MHDSDGRSPYDERHVSHHRRLAVLASTPVLVTGCSDMSPAQVVALARTPAPG
jgi:hypothetical protein